MKRQEKISFAKVIEEVIETGKCCNCGVCETVCVPNVISRDEKNIRGFNDEMCEKCGLCYASCPRTSFSAGTGDESAPVLRIGNYLSIGSYQTSLPELSGKFQDGGLVTSLLLFLLDNKLIDAALITKQLKNWVPEPILTNDRDEIINAAGTIYASSPVFDGLKQLESISLEDLKKFHVEKVDSLRVAVVGLPCQMAAIKKMMDIEIFPANIFKYRISLFCYENFDHDVLYKQKFLEEMKIPLEEIKKVNIKGQMIITRESGTVEKLAQDEFQRLAREGCHYCDDLTGRDSDISCGGIGSSKGFTTGIVRTTKGKGLIDKAIAAGYVASGPVPKTFLVKKIAKIKMKKQKRD
ncbi:MAG: Coenzyme F420 hydrogenase/dehydrogenase, beta subunit C-terminal domain [Promethearchaeota archaeon]